MTPPPADWAADLALDLIAASHALPFRQAQAEIAQRLRKTFPPPSAWAAVFRSSDGDHD